MTPLDTLFFWFFVTHIPITLLVDSQTIFPAFPIQKQALLWWVSFSKDPFMEPSSLGLPTAAWFKAIVLGELLFQIPAFLYLAHSLYHERRAPLVKIVYSTHVCTTLIPMFGELLYIDLPLKFKLILFSAYAPYFLVPFALLVQQLRLQSHKSVKKRQ